MTRKRQKSSVIVTDDGMTVEQMAEYLGADVIALSDPFDDTGWDPPRHFLPHLDKLLQHNREHPESRLGAVKITAWLERNGVMASKDAVYRWLKKRSRIV
jgi:hypothetical protein